MPDSYHETLGGDHALREWLAYPEAPPDDDFTLRVMHRVARERRRRRVILGAFGFIGAGFGLAGAWLLSEPIGGLFGNLPATATMQAALLATAAIAFYGWFMNEDVSLST